jgi:hypothetical protein
MVAWSKTRHQRVARLFFIPAILCVFIATVQQYNMNKQKVVREIYQRIFAHNGWIPAN